jgi:hypothetical protein
LKDILPVEINLTDFKNHKFGVQVQISEYDPNPDRLSLLGISGLTVIAKGLLSKWGTNTVEMSYPKEMTSPEGISSLGCWILTTFIPI